MKVAIIGAGIAGLSCAYELERNGITPVIFEKRSRIGQPAGHAAITIRMMSRSFQDPFQMINKKYGLELVPQAHLNEITMVSPSYKETINGNLGSIFKLGIEAYSIENQIGAHIRTPIQYDTYIELDNIIDKFHHIVVATSDPFISKQLNSWTETFSAQARIAMVAGEFKTSSATIWFNTNYANNGFACLIPNSSKEATLSLYVNKCSARELDYYWEEFIKEEKIQYRITQISDVEHDCGVVVPLKKITYIL